MFLDSHESTFCKENNLAAHPHGTPPQASVYGTPTKSYEYHGISIATPLEVESIQTDLRFATPVDVFTRTFAGGIRWSSSHCRTRGYLARRFQVDSVEIASFFVFVFFAF